MFLTGVREIVSAIGRQPGSGDPKVDDAVSYLDATRNRPGNLGFFGRQGTADAIQTAVRLLGESGKTLTPEQTIAAVEQLRKLDEARVTRSRFWVQVLVTLVALALALAIIFGVATASEDLKKVGYGLIGTVIGYWLK